MCRKSCTVKRPRSRRCNTFRLRKSSLRLSKNNCPPGSVCGVGPLEAAGRDSRRFLTKRQMSSRRILIGRESVRSAANSITSSPPSAKASAKPTLPASKSARAAGPPRRRSPRRIARRPACPHAPLPGDRPRQADLPFPGPLLPAHRHPRQRGQADPGVSSLWDQHAGSIVAQVLVPAASRLLATHDA